MSSCIVVANSQDELRRLLEIKTAELIAKGRKIVSAHGKRVIQKDLFNIALRYGYEGILIWEN